MGTIFKTIGEYFSSGKEFVIPNYQRGYKWAVKPSESTPSAIEVLLDDLVKNYKTNQSYFLQGVTVSEDAQRIELIDGQQRTTTLYLILWYLDYPELKNIKLTYDIREASDKYLKFLREHPYGKDVPVFIFNDNEEDNQDIHYFKEGIRQIHEKLKDEKEKKKLLDYLLNSVRVIYIQVDRNKAVKTFSMMNGSKATMRKEELVKSEMLRLVSLPQVSDRKVSSSIDDNLNDLRETIAKDWETNALRSRYAREWDKWMQWWNREDVVEYFSLDKGLNVIGLLLDYYYKNNSSEKSRFDDFASFRKLLNDERNANKVKEVFKDLRDTQKSFEDLYASPTAYNYLKLALICYEGPEDRLDIVKYYIDHREKEEQKMYALWRLVGAAHRMISGNDSEEGKKEEKAGKVLEHLQDNFVYGNYDEDALRQLLYLNVEQYVLLGKKFNFSIWRNRSLEHIYPKSKVWHKEIVDGREIYKRGNGEEITQKKDTEAEGMLSRDNFEENGSEHCIGNLVLLYKNENSSFNNADFNDKKRLYFNLTGREFESRHLLHTISYFAEEKWGVEEIQGKKDEFITYFKKRYYI